MFLYIRFSAKRSTSYYTTQQAALGDVNGYIEEMVSGQKVVKVFNHEPANLRVFQAKNEALRQGGHRGPELRRHHGAGGGQHFLYQLRHCGGWWAA